MLLALLWLTVSTPFVYADQQRQNTIEKQLFDSAPEEECSNPFSNTTEEKTESGNSNLSEYLHEMAIHEHSFVILETFYKCHPSDLYFAFHPELFSPPPESLS
jgi:hypothetical protein